MTITPNTEITLQQFINVTDSQGLFKTYTDWVYGGYTPLLFNSEVLDAPIVKPTEVIGDNVEFSNIALSAAENFNNQMSSFKPNIPVMDKLVMKLMDDYSVSYSFDFRDKKSAKDWSAYVGDWVNNAYTNMSDKNNMISMETITDYCLANGQYIILPEIGASNISYGENNNWVYNNATAIITNECNKIATSRTKYNLGVSPDRIRMYFGYTPYQNIVRGVNYISNANMSLEAYKSGKWTEVLGYPTQRSMYLTQNFLTDSDPTNNIRDFKFGNYLGLIYSIETLAFYAKKYDILIVPNPTILGQYFWSMVWRANAGIRNARGQLNTLIVKEAPSFQDVTNAYNRLARQVGFYPNLKAPTQEQVYLWNAENDRHFYDIPVQKVFVSAIGSTSISVGGTSQLVARVIPSDLQQGVNWTTSDATIATVDANGLVTAIKAGNCNIKATSQLDSTKSGEIQITVA